MCRGVCARCKTDQLDPFWPGADKRMREALIRRAMGTAAAAKVAVDLAAGGALARQGVFQQLGCFMRELSCDSACKNLWLSICLPCHTDMTQWLRRRWLWGVSSLAPGVGLLPSASLLSIQCAVCRAQACKS